jgi:hypothetical protein
LVYQKPATSRKRKHVDEISKLDMTSDEASKNITHHLNNNENFPSEIPIQKTIGKLKLMNPNKYALKHPAAPLLKEYADDGCPVNCGPDWSKDKIETLLEKGPHSSAKSKEAIKQLRQETLLKISNNYARVVKWGDIKNNLPPKLKLSPVAMIPHKSKKFRCILDLSFTLHKNGQRYSSVNETTKKLSKNEAMTQLGSSLQRIVATLAQNKSYTKPFKFTKLDIKDGFWRMAVNNDEAWNFCYVLPSLKPINTINDIEIVVPNSLQMGWCESPPLFCSGSETARDVIEKLQKEYLQLPAHKFEDDMLRESESNNEHIDNSTTLTEVFVDDFIGITNNLSTSHLTHQSRSMIHGIHSVFPPPSLTHHNGGDPISEQKLAKGEGNWSFQKEILGWDFDGKSFTIQLPTKKCQAIISLLNSTLKVKRASLNKFQKIAGKLQHASFGIPSGRSLFSPIQMAMKGSPDFITITEELKIILTDWRYIIKYLQKNPTSVSQLVKQFPSYIGYTDACRLGAGGAWLSGTKHIAPFLWKVEWPADVQSQLITATNPEGSITINDLELCGKLLGWLALEGFGQNLENEHIVTFCDNTSAVAWAHKLRTSESKIAGRLLRILGLRIHSCKASSLTPLYIPGDKNTMADIISRSFKQGKYFEKTKNLTEYFNFNFPLPQAMSWQEYLIPKEWVSRVIASLRGMLLPLGSLLRLPKQGRNTGKIGLDMPQSAASTRSSPTSAPSNEMSLSPLSLRGCGRAFTVEELKYEFRASLMPSQPSRRPSSWLDNRARSTARIKNTPSPLKEW